MVTNLTYIAEGETLLRYIKDGVLQTLSFHVVNDICPEVTVDSFEGGRAKVYDNIIVFTVLVASGQGGLLFLYDTDKQAFLYNIESPYCIDFLMINQALITLRAVWNYVTPFHFEVYAQLLGSTDSQETPQRVYCEVPQKTNSSDPDDSYLVLESCKLFVVAGSGKHLFSSNVENITNQQPNPEYSFLYEEWESQMDPRKRVLLNMLT